MTKFLSGRQKNLKIGITSYSENTQVLEVIGRVGIGSTVFSASYDLDVRGTSRFSGNVTLGANIDDIVTISGNLGIGTINPTSKLSVVGAGNFIGTVTATEFYGSGIGLTGLISNEIVDVSNDQLYYPILSPVTSGTIPNFSVSSDSIVFNPAQNALGIGTTSLFTGANTGSLTISGKVVIGNSVTNPNISNVLNASNSTGVAAYRAFNLIDTSSVIKVVRLSTISAGPSFELQHWSTDLTENYGYWDFILENGHFALRDRTSTVNKTRFFVSRFGNFLIGANSSNLGINSIQSVGYGTDNILQVDGNSYLGGSVGIGTTTPTSKLWVDGDGYFTGILTANRIFSSQYGEFVGGSISGTSLVGTSLSISGIVTSSAYYIGTSQVISSAKQLQNIASLDATTTATIETAIQQAPNDFTSLNITGISTLQSTTLIGGGTSTGTAGQVLQVTGISSSAYIGGDLGVGTTLPTSKLHVDGNVLVSGVSTFIGGGTSANPSVYARRNANNDAGIKLYGTSGGNWVYSESTSSNVKPLIIDSSQSENIVFKIVGGTKAVIQPSGELLVGSATSTGTADQLLQVNSGAYVFGNLGIGITNTSNKLEVIGGDVRFATSSQGDIQITHANLVSTIKGGTTTQLALGGNGAEVVRINSTGVGIGTTNPQTKLDISGDIRVSSGSTFVFGTGLGIGATAPGYTYALSNPFTSVQIGGTANRRGNALVDITAANYPDGTNVLNVQTTSETYTGTIGTYKPYTPAGTVIEIGNTRASQRVGIGSTLFGRSAALISIYAYNNDNVTNAFFGAVAGDVQNGPSNFVFGRRTGAFSWEETVRIDTSGNLGIGTTNPTSKLHVVGDTYISGILTATDINSASDIRLKTNIKPFENTLEKIVQINGVSFNWIDSNAKSGGIIAQDVEKVFPELVNDGDHKTVNYNGLIGVLIESIKELKQEVEDLKSRLGEI